MERGEAPVKLEYVRDILNTEEIVAVAGSAAAPTGDQPGQKSKRQAKRVRRDGRRMVFKHFTAQPAGADCTCDCHVHTWCLQRYRPSA